MKYQQLLSPDDLDLGLGTSLSRGYSVIQNYWARGKSVSTHRLILSRMLGRPLLTTELVDHINGNPLDNRRSNLRLATHAQNQHNRGKNPNNTSGFKGVTARILKDGTTRWSAQICVDYKIISLGRYDTAHSASIAYQIAALQFHGEYARQ